MKKKSMGLGITFALSLFVQPSVAGNWTEIVVEADSSFRLYVDVDSIHAVNGFGAFRERKDFAGPQHVPGGKLAFSRVEAEVVVDCQEEMLAYADATFLTSTGQVVGRTRLPPSSWHFISPPLGSGGNQEIEVVCASLDSGHLNQPNAPF